MNQCNGGCNSNQHRPSCSCSGERIRVNNFENAQAEDRRRCMCENTCRPRPCKPKPCRPQPCRPDSCRPKPCRPEPCHPRPRPCHNDCDRDDYPHCGWENNNGNCGCRRERENFLEDYGNFDEFEPYVDEENFDRRHRPDCGCDMDECAKGCRSHRRKRCDCDLNHDEFPCSRRYEEDEYDYNDQLFRDQPLAMAYVPKQRWKCPMRNEEGFEKGTIFHDLDKPFKGGCCR